VKHVSEARGRGGRAGTIESASGSYRHDVTLPGLRRPGVTPEELLAGAWVACFGATFIEFAEARGADADAAEYKATVVLEAHDDEYTITEAVLEVDAPAIDSEALEELLATSHQHCPVSKLFTAGARRVEVKAAAHADHRPDHVASTGAE
jgi:osmotically inducible protein OsmC